MKLMIYVMNKPEHLDKFLKELSKNSFIKGAYHLFWEWEED